jgi:ribonuclease III
VTDRASLIEQLGVDIDTELLDVALTHRSYAYEHGGIPNNERLEFLGDSILGQAVTVMLFREYPLLDEGDLAKRRASLVSSLALAEVARSIGLGAHLRLGRGEELTGGREKGSILADAVEAIIGACFLANGPEVATAFVLRLVTPLLDAPDRFGAAMDPKTALQELVASLGRGMPRYVVEGTGPDHARVFRAVVVVDDAELAEGSGTSKKQAEMAAALEAWTRLSAERAAAR